MRPHYSHSSRENATSYSGTSPLASYKEVPPPPTRRLQFNPVDDWFSLAMESELYSEALKFTILWKQHSDSTYESFIYDQVKTRLLELEAKAKELKQTQSMGMCNVIGWSFYFCFRLQQSGFH